MVPGESFAPASRLKLFERYRFAGVLNLAAESHVDRSVAIAGRIADDLPGKYLLEYCEGNNVGLTLEEVDRLLTLPDDTVRGRRDRAILELLYATGIRVNELIAADVDDVNLRIGFFTCPGASGKARIIPIGKPCKVALEE